MFLEILLTGYTAVISAEQSAGADKTAVHYLTDACKYGKERFGVVTPDDGVFHDLTEISTADSVVVDEEAFRRLCRHKALIAYHCHTTDDVLSLFPSAGEDGSDFGTAAYLEYLCSKEETDNKLFPLHIEHRLVHTGGNGSVIRYSIRGYALELARELGTKIKTLSPEASSVTITHGITPDMRPLLAAIQEAREINRSLQDLYALINSEYTDIVVQFIRDACPDARDGNDLQACKAFSILAFAETLDPCGYFYILSPGDTEPEPCMSATQARLIETRYPGFTALTPDTYDAFTATGKVMVAFCSLQIGTQDPPCHAYLARLEEYRRNCPGLKAGFVDTHRYPELRKRHESGWLSVILIDEGYRFTINLNREPTPNMFGMIVCGLNVAIPSGTDLRH